MTVQNLYDKLYLVHKSIPKVATEATHNTIHGELKIANKKYLKERKRIHVKNSQPGLPQGSNLESLIFYWLLMVYL